jgi:protein involved in polysaccharide export with SLBB domain
MVLRLGPIVAMVAVALLGACKYGTRPDDVLSTTQQIDLVESAPLAFAPWTNRAMPYCVGPGDKLRIKFTVTREMDEEVVVSPDGYIGARATGQISVEGRTVPEIENAIRRAARGSVTDQKVVVELMDAVSSKVYVGGSVRQPGSYRISPRQIGVLEAVILAGGVTEEARMGQVALIRRGPKNIPMLRTVNLREMIETGGDADVPMLAGDILYVPRSTVAEVNLWVDQFINKVVPFQRSFSYTLGAYRTSTGGGFIP